MKDDRTSKTAEIKFHLKYVNQRIDSRTFANGYYNLNWDYKDILEYVERDMKEKHPNMNSVMLQAEIKAMKNYFQTDEMSLEYQIQELIKQRGYLQNQIRPIETRENRLFTPKRVVTKPLTIPFNNIKESATFRMAQNWVGKGYTIVFNHMGVRTRYNHDDLYEKIWRWLHDEKRANSYPKHGHYSVYTIPQDLFKVPGVRELIKREQIQVA